MNTKGRSANRHTPSSRAYCAHTISVTQIGQPASRDRVLDISYCADLAPADFSAVAHALKECAEIESPGSIAEMSRRDLSRRDPRSTSMFAGVRCLDLPLNESVASLSECVQPPPHTIDPSPREIAVMNRRDQSEN